MYFNIKALVQNKNKKINNVFLLLEQSKRGQKLTKVNPKPAADPAQVALSVSLASTKNLRKPFVFKNRKVNNTY